MAAAASIVFVTTIFAPGPLSGSAVVMAESLDELAASAESDSGSEATQAYLRKQGIALTLMEWNERRPSNSFGPGSRRHGGILVLGGRTEKLPSGKPVVEILIGCCKRPMKVLMAEKGSDAAFEIGEAAAARNMNHILDTRTVDGYITAVVGKHQAHGLLDIFKVQDAKVSDIQ